MGLGFRCGDCPPGYSGDGLRCDDVNEVNCIYIFFLLLFLFIFFCLFFLCLNHWRTFDISNCSNHEVLNLEIRFAFSACNVNGSLIDFFPLGPIKQTTEINLTD